MSSKPSMSWHRFWDKPPCIAISHDSIYRFSKQELALSVTDDGYRMGPGFLAAYDLRDKPLDGIYRTVIYDRQAGVVLSVRSVNFLLARVEQQFTNTEMYMHDYTLSLLGIKERHIISCGSYAYFSFYSFRHRPLDLVGLCPMVDFAFADQKAAFRTSNIPCRFLFDVASRPGKAKHDLQAGLTHNWAIKFYLQQLNERHGAAKPKWPADSILHQPGYVAGQTMKKLEATDFMQAARKCEEDLAQGFSLEFLRKLEYPLYGGADIDRMLDACRAAYKNMH